MEYILFINSELELEKVNDKILNILSNSIYGKVEILNKNEELSLYCDLFTLNMNSTSDYIRTMREEANMDLNIELYMDLDMNCTDVIKKTVHFVGECLKSFEGNAILLSNSDIPIVKRSEEKVIVDSSRIRSNQMFPFEELDEEYFFEKIKLASDL